MLPLVAKKDHIQLMGHVIADYPDRKTVLELVKVMVDAGVAMIEIQIPFSEPMADGPVFMIANQRALERGVTVAASFELMALLSKTYPQTAFVFMSYANILFRKGYDAFVKAALDAGARGVLAPDLAFDTADELIALGARHDFAFIPVVPPNIQASRLQEVAAHAQGLVYAVARTGVTGGKTSIDGAVTTFLKRVREATPLPVACGFGISSPEHIRQLSGHADLAVIGSKSLTVLEEFGLEEVRNFWKSLARATC